MKYNLLPKWNTLTKEEKARLKEVLNEQPKEELLGEDSLGKIDLENIAKAVKPSKEISSVSTPINIPNTKFIDYRNPIWGNSYTWSWIRPLYQVKYLVIHHTVTKHNATPDDIALLHKARGWAGIGYHFLITQDGTIYYVGDIGTARANVLNMNEKVIGISLIGDFTKHLPSDGQITSAHKLCDYLISQYPALKNIQSWDCVVGHKDLQATACPGTSWPNDMRDRIIKGIIYTPPQPTPEKDYQTLYEQLKEDYANYKSKIEPKAELYNWSVGQLNTNMEEYKNTILELLREGDRAKKLYESNLTIVGKTRDELVYPEGVPSLIEEVSQKVAKLELYKEIINLVQSTDETVIQSIKLLQDESKSCEILFQQALELSGKTGYTYPKDAKIVIKEMDNISKELKKCRLDENNTNNNSTTIIALLISWLQKIFELSQAPKVLGMFKRKKI